MRLAAAILILPASVAAILWLTTILIGGSGPGDATNEPDLGRYVYMTRCISCHQVDGRGISAYFPPLDGTDWIVEEKGRLIRIVLHGMTGPTLVQGVDYNGAMPAWGPVLSDDEIAAVLTYVRSTWGNRAPAVRPVDVRAVRAATAERTQPWTHDDLTAVENVRIPSEGTVSIESESSTDH